eukprot:jgi/Ulvmu1/9149/UM005_0247.1
MAGPSGGSSGASDKGSDNPPSATGALHGAQSSWTKPPGLPILPSLPARHLGLGYNSMLLSKLRVTCTQSCRVSKLGTPSLHHRQSEPHMLGHQRAQNANIFLEFPHTPRLSGGAQVSPMPSSTDLKGKPAKRASDDLGQSSQLLQPCLTHQKYKALCLRSKMSKFLPAPVDTFVHDEIEASVRMKLEQLAENRHEATCNRLPAALGNNRRRQFPEDRMAKALLDLVDLPMISMPQIKYSCMPRPVQLYQQKMDTEAGRCTLFNPFKNMIVASQTTHMS